MPDNTAYLAEFDNPNVFFGRGSELIPLEREVREYGGRAVKESRFEVRDGDWIVLVSDGVLHAGIGGIWNPMGLGARASTFAGSLLTKKRLTRSRKASWKPPASSTPASRETMLPSARSGLGRQGL